MYPQPTELIMSEPPIRVLYLHGFEEHDLSPKPMALKMLRDRIHLDMPALGVYFSRRHSPLIGFLRSRAVHLYLIFAAASFFSLYVLSNVLSKRVIVLCVLGVLFSFASVFPHAKRQALQFSLKKSFAIAKKRLHEFQPDIVVGFSWGGCLAATLLHQQVCSVVVLKKRRDCFSFPRDLPLFCLL